MIDPASIIGPAQGAGLPAGAAPPGKTGPGSFSELLRRSIDEVNRLQQEADRAVEGLATGSADDLGAVLTAVEKADLAFKTLLAIRAKLMEAYEETRTMQI